MKKLLFYKDPYYKLRIIDMIFMLLFALIAAVVNESNWAYFFIGMSFVSIYVTTRYLRTPEGM